MLGPKFTACSYVQGWVRKTCDRKGKNRKAWGTRKFPQSQGTTLDPDLKSIGILSTERLGSIGATGWI